MSGSAELLGDLGERGIQERVLKPRYGATKGFGDDSALLGLVDRPSELVATTDSCPTPLVNSLGEPDLYHAGWLLATINLSDLAAAGAEPLGLVVNYTLPKSTPVADFERLLAGVDDCCAGHGTRVVGGDIRDGAAVQLSATAIGRCAPGHRLGRAGAQAGDRLLLVGSPGFLWAAALLKSGRASVLDSDAEQIWERACRPMAQLKAGRRLAATEGVRVAMDVSDGLFATVRTLCDVNGVGAAMNVDFELDDRVAMVQKQTSLRPFDLAQTWGDWCLVTAVPAAQAEKVRTALAEDGCTVHEIGELVPPDHGITLRSETEVSPWYGIAQERFSPSSWHGGELPALLADVLGMSQEAAVRS